MKVSKLTFLRGIGPTFALIALGSIATRANAEVITQSMAPATVPQASAAASPAVAPQRLVVAPIKAAPAPTSFSSLAPTPALTTSAWFDNGAVGMFVLTSSSRQVTLMPASGVQGSIANTQVPMRTTW